MKNFFFVAIAPEDDFSATNECSLLHMLFAAEPKHLRARRRIRRAGPIVGVQDRKVLLGLILENARFSGSISRQRLVAVQVIWRQIQEHRDLRLEIFDQFKLEAA
jgi:hypothetical protein